MKRTANAVLFLWLFCYIDWNRKEAIWQYLFLIRPTISRKMCVGCCWVKNKSGYLQRVTISTTGSVSVQDWTDFGMTVYKPDHNRIDLFVDWHGKSFATVLTGNLYDGDEGFYRFLGRSEFVTIMPGSKKTVEITAWVFKESIELLVSKKKTS